jgi:uncharacterized protein
MNISFRYLRGIVLTTLLTAFALPSQADTDPVRYVEVSASGTVSAAPDNALLSLSVVRTGKTARQALDANNAAMTKVLSGLVKAGISKTDLQTSGFSMQPRYVHPKPGRDGQRPAPVLTGYSVSNQLAVRIRDIGRVGAVLDQVVSLGVNQIGNIRFMVEEPDQLRDQARVAAVKNARKKALTLTRTGEVSLGRMLSVTEQSTGLPPQLMRAERAMMSAPGRVPVAEGEISFRVDVRVRWALAD